MNHAHDRRGPTARIPFDAMVEVGGTLGPSFEAQAIDLSEAGMSLRTAYLPEVGQPVMCRFDAGQGAEVVAAGEVLWNDPGFGKFGIRFTNLDGSSNAALQRMLGLTDEGRTPPADGGRKVRLHIEGLASPMRARVRDQATSGVTAYSDLGFLQMGKALELEDAASGTRRPASIDRVQVEIDEASRVPQLVVSLRYEDVPEIVHASSLAGMEVPASEPVDDEADDPPASDPGMERSADLAEEAPAEPAIAVSTSQPGADADDEAALEEESNRLKGTFARNAAKVTPALLSWAKRAKVAAALVAAKARRGEATGDDVEIPVRRTTAPAPGGGLHTSGRKVVRGSLPDAAPAAPAAKTLPFKMTKRKAAVVGSIGVAAILATFALRKPAAAPELASAPPAAAASVEIAAATTPAPLAEPTPTAPAMPAPAPEPLDPLATAAVESAPKPVRRGKPTPFTNGPVGAHPTVLRIKMDGPIEGIQGATQPTGITIVTPNTMVMDPSTSLASKDPRLENVHIANEDGSAELNLTFKQAVPNYIVRARGETLEVLLAKPTGPGRAEASATSAKKAAATKATKATKKGKQTKRR